MHKGWSRNLHGGSWIDTVRGCFGLNTYKRRHKIYDMFERKDGSLEHAYIDLCYLYVFSISTSNTHTVQLELMVYTSNVFASPNTVLPLIVAVANLH